MPNLNLKDDPINKKSQQPLSPFKRQPMSSGGSKTIPILIILCVIVLVVVIVYLLNQFGYIHLWEKKGEVAVVEKVQEPVETQPIVTEAPEVSEAVAMPETEIEKPAAEVKTPVKEVEKFKEGTGKYTIYIGSFRDKARADTEALRWKDAGYFAGVTEKTIGKENGKWYRVYLGSFGTKDEAIKTAKSLSQSFEAGYWIDMIK